MATAFAATKMQGPHTVGPNLKFAIYHLQLSSSWTAAGEAWDLSTDFDYVYAATFGASGAVTDFADYFDIIGTKVTTGRGAGGIAASGVSVVGHRDPVDAGAAVSAMTATPNATDLSGVNDLTVIVWGC